MALYPDIGQDFWLTDSNHTYTKFSGLSCRGIDFTLSQKHPGLFPRKGGASLHICTTVLWKDPTNTGSNKGRILGQDKAIFKQTNNQLTFSNGKIWAVSPKHLRLPCQLQICDTDNHCNHMKHENFEGDKNTGDSRNFTSLFLKGKDFIFPEKTAKWEWEGRHFNRKGAVSSVWGAGNKTEGKQHHKR